MRQRFLSVVALLSGLLLTFSSAVGQVRVKGYFRKDGSYVAPHYRSSPDGNPYNNYSYRPPVVRGGITPYQGGGTAPSYGGTPQYSAPGYGGAYQTQPYGYSGSSSSTPPAPSRRVLPSLSPNEVVLKVTEVVEGGEAISLSDGAWWKPQMNWGWSVDDLVQSAPMGIKKLSPSGDRVIDYSRATRLGDIDGYTYMGSTRVSGDFDGADFGKIVRLENGDVFSFKSYFHYQAYRPEVHKFSNGSDCKLLIRDVVCGVKPESASTEVSRSPVSSPIIPHPKVPPLPIATKPPTGYSGVQYGGVAPPVVSPYQPRPRYGLSPTRFSTGPLCILETVDSGSDVLLLLSNGTWWKPSRTFGWRTGQQVIRVSPYRLKRLADDGEEGDDYMADQLDDLNYLAHTDSCQVDGNFEGAEYDKPVRLTNGAIFTFTCYRYHYAYRPSVEVFSDGRQYRLLIDGEVYSAQRLR